MHANLTVQEVFEDEEEDIFWEMKTCLACKFAGTGGFEDSSNNTYFGKYRPVLYANLPVPEVLKTRHIFLEMKMNFK